MDIQNIDQFCLKQRANVHPLFVNLLDSVNDTNNIFKMPHPLHQNMLFVAEKKRSITSGAIRWLDYIGCHGES